jgi:hypothetical protein
MYGVLNERRELGWMEHTFSAASIAEHEIGKRVNVVGCPIVGSKRKETVIMQLGELS